MAAVGLTGVKHGWMQEAVNPAELKRIIEGLPLETSAVAAVEWRLGQLDPTQFAALLTELARDNHAFRCVPPTTSTTFVLPSVMVRLKRFSGVDAVSPLTCRPRCTTMELLQNILQQGICVGGGAMVSEATLVAGASSGHALGDKERWE